MNGDYPAWICGECGNKYGRMPTGHIATWHLDTCGWCNQQRICTEPRDYRYPPQPVKLPVVKKTP